MYYYITYENCDDKYLSFELHKGSLVDWIKLTFKLKLLVYSVLLTEEEYNELKAL